jgi:hypothetical protein
MFIQAGRYLINPEYIILVFGLELRMRDGSYQLHPEEKTILMRELNSVPKPAKEILAQVKQEREKEGQDWNKR